MVNIKELPSLYCWTSCTIALSLKIAFEPLCIMLKLVWYIVETDIPAASRIGYCPKTALVVEHLKQTFKVAFQTALLYL